MNLTIDEVLSLAEKNNIDLRGIDLQYDRELKALGKAGRTSYVPMNIELTKFKPYRNVKGNFEIWLGDYALSNPEEALRTLIHEKVEIRHVLQHGNAGSIIRDILEEAHQRAIRAENIAARFFRDSLGLQSQ